MQKLCILGLVSSVDASYSVKSEVITVTGAFCGPWPEYTTENSASGTYKATVWYPTDKSEKYPVLSFAHGGSSFEWSVPKTGYSGLIEGVAAAGYIVIALNGCALTTTEWHAQVSSLEYMRTKGHTLKDIVDYNAHSGVFGHHMGGSSTICAASRKSSKDEAKIAAAVAMHGGDPSFGLFEQNCQIPGQPRPLVPTLYFGGDDEDLEVVKSIYGWFPKTVARGYALFKGYTKLSPCGPGSKIETKWIVAWMDCYVKKHQSGCDKIYGSKGLCKAGETTSCEVHHSQKMMSNESVLV